MIYLYLNCVEIFNNLNIKIMKKLSIIVSILIINFTVYSQGFNDVCSPSSAYVYAAGNSGVVLKSSNGGTSYSSMVISVNYLNSIYSVGGTVWTAGDNGFLGISTNFSNTWLSQTLSGGTKLNAVFFTDTLNGFIGGNNGILMKSTDGGISWNNLTSGVSFNILKIKFVDANTGYCSGESNLILKTTDSGVSWNSISVPSTGNLRCFDLLANEMIAGSSSDILYKSTNNGLNWSSIKLNIQSHPGINAIAITAAQKYVLVFESGTIWSTSNGGSSFSYNANEFLDELNSIVFQGQRAFAVSKKQSVVIRSLNFGLTWALTPNSTYSIFFVTLLSGNFSNYNKILDMNYQKRGVLYALEREKLYRTLNYGGNWSVMSTVPVDSNANNSNQLMVSKSDSSKMLAAVNTIGLVGGEYRCSIYRTSNYGQSWERVLRLNIDYIGNFMNQDPQHPDTIYIGAKDTVFRSTNFGANWTKICEAPFEDWCDISVKYDNSQILYGSTNHYPAKINKSTNGGLNWFFVDFIADTNYSEMPAIALSNLNPNILLHAQYSSNTSQTGLKRSYTNGNSWLFNQFPGISWSVDIAKDDPNLYAYGSVSYDPVFLSTNSGGNFFGTSNLYAEQILYYDRANLYLNNHGIISKMRIVYNMPVIGIQTVSSEIPKEFSLEQNYPNPFNPSTRINFSISKSSNAKLVIYDITGKEIFTLADEKLQPGIYNVKWDAVNYPSGVYFYKLYTEDFSESKKMILVK